MELRQAPTAEDRELASAIYRQFVELPGSEHIATEFALTYLSRLLFEAEPKRVLEVGAGIGTITKLLLAHPCLVEHIISTEGNEFCLSALANNIGPGYGDRWRVVRAVDDILDAQTYDLVIFDGYSGVDQIYRLLGAGTICFVEGIRHPIREGLNRHLSDRNMACIFSSYIRPNKLRFSRNKKLFGFLPKPKFRTNKGCHIGKITLAQA